MISKIREGLDWRGPNGKGMGHIVLTRKDAEALVEDYEELKNAYLRLMQAIEAKGRLK